MNRISKIPWVALIVCGRMFSGGSTVKRLLAPITYSMQRNLATTQTERMLIPL